MTKEEKSQLRKKWRRWLTIIGNDLSSLLISQDIFKEIQKIIAANKKIQSPDLFYRWMKVNYAARMAVGIRRLVQPSNLSDKKKMVISLHRLIKDISQQRDAIDRDCYVRGYQLRDAGIANEDFDTFTDNSRDTLISKSKLNKDMVRLKEETKRIKIFRDKWIAHRGLRNVKGTIKRLPTFKDVDNALNLIDEILDKYTLLLTRSSLTTRKPIHQYDWKEPLRHAWIESDPKE